MTRRKRRRRKDEPIAVQHLATMEVDNPHWTANEAVPKRIDAMLATRDDVLNRMYARGEIDRAELKAGRDYQRLAELEQVAPITGIDPTQDPVDTSRRVGEPFVDSAKIDAMRKRQRIDAMLGRLDALIFRRVLVDGWSFATVALKWGWNPARHSSDMRALSHRFRTALNLIATHGA